MEVPGGDYTFAVTPANASTELVRFNPIALENGKAYTLVAHGTLDAADNADFGVRAFTDNDDGAAYEDLSDTQVMAVNLTPNAGPVDLYVDDESAGTNLAYSENTGYMNLNSGTRTIRVNTAGTQNAVSETDLDCQTGKRYTYLVADDNMEPLVLEDDFTPPPAGMAYVRFVHLAPDAPPVDVAADGTVLFNNVAYGESDNGGMFTAVDAGTYDLEVRAAGTNTPVLTVNNVALNEGAIYTLVAEGYANPVPGQPALNVLVIENRETAVSPDTQTPSDMNPPSDVQTPDMETPSDIVSPVDMETPSDSDMPSDMDNPDDMQAPSDIEPPMDMTITPE